ncbi:SPOR domain-containing protein [Tunturiibacter lichenicola]|uniref:SPOR domain-containing protein n=1 Tax=Tunturiibacter lichenicola TaxID=2051959 RepID=UPI003D9ABEEB
MELWTEYEGRTIDGAFRLTKLIRPEGRSAFFSTSNGTGIPTVIRLIESHFDDDEILARWRGVQALDHANLIKLKSFGQVTVDETSLVYAVMEPVEANLGEILAERRLSVVETKQVATSLVSAIGALHSNGFVHEHIEPANVLAVGEEIKLRSDCIRETPEGDEGSELKRWDVYDLSVVFLQALTQHKTLEEAERELPLQAPFDEIVRKGMSGEWRLPEIAAALNMSGEVPPVVRASVAMPKVEVSRPLAPVPEAQSVVARSVPVPVDEVDGEPRGIEMKRLVIGVGAMLLLLVVWFFVHGRAAKSNGAVQQTAAPPAVAQGSDAAAPSAADSTAQAPAMPAPEAAPAAAAPASVPTASETKTAGDARGQWRVVAYTYSREAQAQQKVASVAAKHPQLKPEVFTPNGHAPYLVVVGGAMSRDEAFALVRKAKGEGWLPRDSYAQNYRGAGR